MNDNQKKILETIGKNPGVTSKAINQLCGFTWGYTSGTISRFVNQGIVIVKKKDGMRLLYLKDRQTKDSFSVTGELVTDPPTPPK